MMIKNVFLIVFVFAFIAPQQEEASGVFLIGNSLTYGTLPGELDGEVDYHIQPNENLHQILTDPWIGADDATLWTEALTGNQYSVIVVQIYKGTTLGQDFEAIKTFADLQPDADIVVFTGWPKHSVWEAVYPAGPVNEIGQSKTYIGALLGALQEEYPGRDVKSSGHLRVLNSIREDEGLTDSALGEFENLFRDETHLSYEAGRYLSHNLMRAALGQRSNQDLILLDSDVQAYLDLFIASEFERSGKRYFLPIIWGDSWK